MMIRSIKVLTIIVLSGILSSCGQKNSKDKIQNQDAEIQETVSQEPQWNNEFLEKKYHFEYHIISKAMDSIFKKTVAYSTEEIENGAIVSNGVGDKNGKWNNWNGVSTIEGITIKEGGMIISQKWVEEEDGVIIGFKTEDNDKIIPAFLHDRLQEFIPVFNLPDA